MSFTPHYDLIYLLSLLLTKNRTDARFDNASKLLTDLSESRLSQIILNLRISKVANILEPERDNIAKKVMKSVIVHRKIG